MKDTVERFAQNLRNSNNVVDYDIQRYPEHDYDSINVTFDSKGYNFTLLRGDRGFEFNIQDLHSVNKHGRIVAVIHVYDDDSDE